MNDPKIITPAERAARKTKRLGLGDIVASVATPIAAALHLDCVDQETKQLKPESPCAKRKADWNKIKLPFSAASNSTPNIPVT